MSNHIQMRPAPEAMSWLEGRAARMHASAPLQAKAELALWQAVLGAELRRIRLTVAQAYCAAAAVGSSDLKPVIALTVGSVYGALYEQCRIAREGPVPGSWCNHFGVDEQELLRYLGSLGPAADHALADAISRWWDQDLDATAEGFAMAGLKVTGQ